MKERPFRCIKHTWYVLWLEVTLWSLKQSNLWQNFNKHFKNINIILSPLTATSSHESVWCRNCLGQECHLNSHRVKRTKNLSLRRFVWEWKRALVLAQRHSCSARLFLMWKSFSQNFTALYCGEVTRASMTRRELEMLNNSTQLQSTKRKLFSPYLLENNDRRFFSVTYGSVRSANDIEMRAASSCSCDIRLSVAKLSSCKKNGAWKTKDREMTDGI